MNYTTDGNFHTDLIELLARRMRPSVYVELGVGRGEWTIRRVARHCGRAVGCDITVPDGPEIRIYEFHHYTTHRFIAEILPTLGPVELAFIDADHAAAEVEDDFRGLLPHMAIDGIIALHDTYPQDASYLTPQRCGDSWLAAYCLRAAAAGLGIEVLTLPTPPGLTLVRKNVHQLHWNPEAIS